MNETINTQVTSCKPDPDWEEAAQSCLKMGPVYFDVLVYTDSFWFMQCARVNIQPSCRVAQASIPPQTHLTLYNLRAGQELTKACCGFLAMCPLSEAMQRR
eukprot:1142186-Pelagomonas_calceolata.AAC.3